MTTAERPMGVAMIGTGMVARTHLSAIRDADVPVRLVGVLSRSTDRAGRFAAEAAGELGAEVTVYSDVAAICRDDRVDIALILTPPDARRSLIAPLAAAGKAVLLEKPVGRTLAEAEDVVTLCEAAGVPLGIVFQHRMREASVAAKALVGSGRLGALGLAEISVPWWREQAYYDEPGRGTYGRDGGGVLISQAIHTMDLALTLTGPVTCVTAMTGTTGLHTNGGRGCRCLGPALCQWRAGLADRIYGQLPGRVREHHAPLRTRKPAAGRGCACTSIGAMAGRRHTALRRPPAAALIPMAFTHDWHTGAGGFRECSYRPGSARRSAGGMRLAAHELIHAITTSARHGPRIHLQQTGKPMSLQIRRHRHRSPSCLRHDRTPDRCGCVLRRMVDGRVPETEAGFRETICGLPGLPTMRSSTGGYRPGRHRRDSEGSRSAGHRGDARRQGRDGRQTRLHHAGSACGACAPFRRRPGASGPSITPSGSRCPP
jgi:hypothetical protein